MSIPTPPPYPASPEPLLSEPYYGASIGVAFSRFWKKYATFSGRASRSEYWWWELIYFIFGIILEILLASTGVYAAVASGSTYLGPGYFVVVGVAWIVGLATLVPTLALTWRRLHDTNRSGGFYFIGFIPLVGWIILLVFVASASNPAGARFDEPR